MFKLRLELLFSLFFISFLSFSQTGTIRGIIKDAKSNEDLIGATIKIEGTPLGALTDINGFFSISKVTPGKYKLKISYVSYSDKILDVEVNNGLVTEVNALLIEEGSVLQEVKVTASRLTNTEVSVISEIKAAQQIVSGIGAAQISKTLDRNAAEVVKRVPGITIFNDKFINIRGLNERYNTVLLNNVFTPSMETDARSFSFDIIPSNQIDRIMVFKSPAAELPGEFSGGVVKIFTKSVPERNSLTLDYGTSFRENTTGKTFFEPPHGSNYGLGFNDGFSSLPKYFPTTRKEILTATPDRLAQIGQSLRNTWTPLQSTATPDQRLALTGTYKIEKGNIKIGNVSAINYSNTRTNFEMLKRDFEYSRISSGGEATEVFNFQDGQYSRAIRLGALFNTAVRFNENNTIEFKNLYNQLSNGQFVNRNGFENGSRWNIRSFDQIYRGIYTGQLVGRHAINANKTSFDWAIGYNNSFRDQPDYKRFKYNIDGTTPILLIPQGAAQTFNLGRTNIKLNENAKTAALNFVQKIAVSKEKELELKAGSYVELKERQFDARNLAYVQANSSLFNLWSLPIEQVFESSNINSTTGIKIDEQTNPNDSYHASNHLIAYYASGNYPITKNVNMIAGVRVEDNYQQLNSYDLVNNPLTYNNHKINALPSVNLSYHFSEKSLLRIAYGKTLNRPEFREIAPFSFYDFVNNRNIQGNSSLKNAEIQNLDLRYEFYPTPSEVVSIATFYKNFRNPIEVVFANGSNPNITFDNADKAYSTGVEIEIRKSFDKITSSEFLNKINLVFNSAFIYSRVKLKKDIAANQSDNRPLQGQSPYIINGGLNYNNPKTSLQVNILYNVIGKRIYAVGNNYGYAYPDWYEMPRNVVDITFSKGIGNSFIIKGGITDVLNQSAIVLQDGNQDNKYDTGADQIIQSFKPGRVFSLGVSYILSKK